MVGQVRVGVVVGVCTCKGTCKYMQDDRCMAMPVRGWSVGRAEQGDRFSAGVMNDGRSRCCCLYAGSQCILDIVGVCKCNCKCSCMHGDRCKAESVG